MTDRMCGTCKHFKEGWTEKPCDTCMVRDLSNWESKENENK